MRLERKLVIIAAWIGSTAAVAVPFDKQAWLDDYMALRRHLAETYANLEDKVNYGVVDPMDLNRQTLAAISTAHTEKDALRALVAFVAAFRDGHLHIKNLKDVAKSYGIERRAFPVRLREDNTGHVMIQEPASGCAALAGKEITTINGRPAREDLKDASALVAKGNVALQHQLGLEGMTKGFFVADELRLSGTDSSGHRVVCSWSAKPLPPASTSNSPSHVLTGTTPGKEACAQMGIYQREGADGAFRLGEVGSFERSNAQPTYLAGYWRPTPKVTAGYWRIPAFGEYGYPGACESEWDAFRGTLTKECDQECQWQFQYRHIVPHLLGDAKRVVEEMNARHVETLIIDVTGNGGGGDWVDNVARLVSPKSALPCQAIRRIKHPSTTKSYASELADVEKNLTKSGLSSADIKILGEARTLLAAMADEARGACDREGYWTKHHYRPKCTLLMPAGDHICGLFPYLPPGALGEVESRQPLFKALDQPYEEALFKGRELRIVIDRDTASSAEQFASMLVDAGIATAIGEPSNAAGCGYINGGAPIRLPHSGLEIKVPNCVRQRKDGRNEVFGIEPAKRLPWVREGAMAATRSLADTISR